MLAASVAAPALTEPPGIAVGVLALLAGLLADLAVTVRGRVHHRSRMVSTP